MASPDAACGGGLLHSLSAVVQFLHAEGFLGAEEALLREIELKYENPRDATTASPASSREGGGDSGGGGVAPLPQVDLQPALAAVQSVPPLESMESAEK